ncbi:MAG: response regulator transcription factor, partial [Deltaproteobacteria bacterium]|nr:response regulator transcription factor [Deltaproteobacteria bacterium]
MAVKHVLVVSADTEVARILATALELESLDVSIENSAEKAAEHFREIPTQLVIIDLGSLESAGVDLCASIRALAEGATVPLIFVGTGREQVTSLAEALVAGADYFFRRPIEAARIVGRVLTYLGSGAAPAVASDLIVPGGRSVEPAPAAATAEVAASEQPSERARDSTLSAIDEAIDDALRDALDAVPTRLRPATDREVTVVGPAPEESTDAAPAAVAEVEATTSTETSDLISRLKRLQQATQSAQRSATGPALEKLVDEMVAADQASAAVASGTPASAPVEAAAGAPPVALATAQVFPEVTLPDLSIGEGEGQAAPAGEAAGADPYAGQRQEAEALKLEIDRAQQRGEEALAEEIAARQRAEESARGIEEEARQRAEESARGIEE